MGLISFVRNYDDLSTDKGYQFKFHCDRCGNGHLSRFQASMMGTASSFLQAAGNMLGGVFGSAASSAYEIQRAVGGPAHDEALRAAVEEARPNFVQCTGCGNRVCRQVCWNVKRGLCVDCAPRSEVVIAKAQSEAEQEQVREKVRQKDQTTDLELDATMSVRCPSCEAQVKGGKFCPECGAKRG